MTLQAATEGTTLRCPKCGGEKVVRRRTWLSAAIFLALFGISIVAAAVTPYTTGVGLLLGLVALILFAVSVSTVVGATFGKNRCKDCGNKWR